MLKLIRNPLSWTPCTKIYHVWIVSSNFKYLCKYFTLIILLTFTKWLNSLFMLNFVVLIERVVELTSYKEVVGDKKSLEPLLKVSREVLS